MLEDWSCHWVVYLMSLECSSLFSLSCFGMSSMHALLVWLELCISSWAFFCSEWLYIENWIGPDLSFDCLSVGNTHGAPRNLTLARTLIEWTSSFLFFLKAIMVIFRQVCWEMMTVLLPWGRQLKKFIFEEAQVCQKNICLLMMLEEIGHVVGWFLLVSCMVKWDYTSHIHRKSMLHRLNYGVVTFTTYRL